VVEPVLVGLLAVLAGELELLAFLQVLAGVFSHKHRVATLVRAGHLHFLAFLGQMLGHHGLVSHLGIALIAALHRAAL